jgi:hypothetical protein
MFHTTTVLQCSRLPLLVQFCGRFTDASLERDSEQRCENREISRKVRREAPVLAGMTKAPAGDIESAKFGRDRGEREDQDQSN